MKLRWKILIAAGIVFALLAASLTVTLHVQPANELDAYKKFLRDKGEKLEISEVLPPGVANGSNGAALANLAFDQFPDPESENFWYSNLPSAMQMIAPGKAVAAWAQRDVRWTDYKAYTDSWENAQAIIAAERPAMELLQKAAALPALDFHLDYQRCWSMEAPHLDPIRHSAQFLAAAAICSLELAPRPGLGLAATRHAGGRPDLL